MCSPPTGELDFSFPVLSLASSSVVGLDHFALIFSLSLLKFTDKFEEVSDVANSFAISKEEISELFFFCTYDIKLLFVETVNMRSTQMYDGHKCDVV